MTKVVPPKGGWDTKPRSAEVLLPLDAKPTEANKHNSVSFSVRTNPADADSPKFSIYVLKIQGGETISTLIQWKRDFNQLMNAMALTSGAAIHKIAKSLLSGNPDNLHADAAINQATVAKNAAIAAVPVVNPAAPTPAEQQAVQAVRDQELLEFLTPAMVDQSINHMLSTLMPAKALARIKRYYRRDCRKPRDMLVRDYWQHLARVNMVELPSLPPNFNGQQAFTEDELLDILLYGTPKSWTREMDRQGHDPYLHTLQETVDFMEQIELSEDGPKEDSKPAAKKGNGNGSPKKKQKGEGEFYCSHHGKNNTHKTEDCRTLKKKEGKSDKKPFGNKSWTRKSEESVTTSKKELAVFINKLIKAGVKKELASITKKRKSEDSDDDAFDLGAFEKALENYEMDVSEDGEISDEFSV